ncbi:MAG: hypothetical protein LC685_03675 [Actinobacteria bacterium]|nr:hypothetical protein [Actinomycetota bacterium]
MPRKLIGAVLASVAVAFTAPAGALAVPAQLTVTNLALPGLESDVPQPPVSVAARWNCGTPYSAYEANTGISPCAPGSWPPSPGWDFPDWRPAVEAAGGDRLQLTFDAPVEQVRYAATTNFPKGFLNPVGQPHPNVDIITARDAHPTSDAKIWSVELSRFDDTGHPPGPGYTFPVVARVGTMWRNFVLSLTGPRWNDREKRCGLFWNPDQVDRGCLMPPGPPPFLGSGADRRAPSLSVRVARRQRVRRLGHATASARCNELCTLKVTGRLRAGGRSYKLRAASKQAGAGKRVLLRIRLTSGATRALGSGQRATIALAVRARDSAGNGSEPTRRTIAVR